MSDSLVIDSSLTAVINVGSFAFSDYVINAVWIVFLLISLALIITNLTISITSLLNKKKFLKNINKDVQLNSNNRISLIIACLMVTFSPLFFGLIMNLILNNVFNLMFRIEYLGITFLTFSIVFIINLIVTFLALFVPLNGINLSKKYQ